MFDKDTLKERLASIDGRDYGDYQSLLGNYEYPLFKLIIQQIPKDPYAPPPTGIYRIQVKRADVRIINMDITSKVQEIAFRDYLARNFYSACNKHCKGQRGTGFSGLISIDEPGQAILERSSVVVTNELIEVRCFLGLPAKGRKISAEIAEKMFLTELEEIVQASLLAESIEPELLQSHINVAEDADYLRKKLDSLGLIAFIANGSNLPRETGTSDKPLLNEQIVSFIAPSNLTQEIKLPNAGPIKGLAISKGITLITGGGYHGKSTLLYGLETGIYNHIPGDGREYCVSNRQAVKIRAYDGRYVNNTDISAFITNLPFQKNTQSFSTENASGSTSQAANLIEAIEVGAEVILMDEDTCATNFMTRDRKMQQLVKKQDEPITVYIDKVQQLYTEKNISTILVLGGVGDYFDVADRVIQMINFAAYDVTTKAHQIAANSPLQRLIEVDSSDFELHQRIPLAKSINPYNKNKKFAIRAQQVRQLNFGTQFIDLTDLEQLIELSQSKAIGFALEYAKKYMVNNATLNEVIRAVSNDIEGKGIDIISDKISGHFAEFRALELAFVMNRLRSFEVIQKEN